MECERSADDDPLRQGDIIAAQPSSNSWQNPWTRFGVILTADCDLAQNKAGPNLVYLPLIDHYTYISDVWLPSEIAALSDTANKAVEKTLSTLGNSISTRHLNAWFTAGGDDEVKKHLGQLANVEPKPNFNQEILDLWHVSRKLTESAQRPAPRRLPEIRGALNDLFAHKAALPPKKSIPPAARRSTIENVFASAQSRLDTWLVRELSGLDADMDEANRLGFIIPLRSVSLLPIAQVETKRDIWYQQKNQYLRICRLRGIYKADLVQRFANLFARVGLEDHREREHQRLFKRCAENLCPEAIE